MSTGSAVDSLSRVVVPESTDAPATTPPPPPTAAVSSSDEHRLPPLADTIAQRLVFAPLVQDWFAAAFPHRNPGTTADLVCASLFVALREGIISVSPAGQS